MYKYLQEDSRTQSVRPVNVSTTGSAVAASQTVATPLAASLRIRANDSSVGEQKGGKEGKLRTRDRTEAPLAMAGHGSTTVCSPCTQEHVLQVKTPARQPLTGRCRTLPRFPHCCGTCGPVQRRRL